MCSSDLMIIDSHAVINFSCDYTIFHKRAEVGQFGDTTTLIQARVQISLSRQIFLINHIGIVVHKLQLPFLVNDAANILLLIFPKSCRLVPFGGNNLRKTNGPVRAERELRAARIPIDWKFAIVIRINSYNLGLMSFHTLHAFVLYACFLNPRFMSPTTLIIQFKFRETRYRSIATQ